MATREVPDSVDVDNIPSEVAYIAECHRPHDMEQGHYLICSACEVAWPCDAFRAIKVVERLNVELRSAYEAAGF